MSIKQGFPIIWDVESAGSNPVTPTEKPMKSADSVGFV